MDGMESIMLSEISQMVKDKHRMMSLITELNEQNKQTRKIDPEAWKQGTNGQGPEGRGEVRRGRVYQGRPTCSPHATCSPGWL